MSDLDATFELLSSMSPKLVKKGPTKTSKKSPHKLAVKNRIRRSSFYDKSPHSHHVRDTSVIVIDDSILSDKLSPKQQLKIIKTPIIISSSSESEIEELNEKEIIEDKRPVVEQSKFVDINNWLSENEKVDGYSEVYSFENNSLSESDDDKLNISKKSETKQKSPSGVWKVVSIESKLGKEPIRDKVDEEIFPKPLNSTSLQFDVDMQKTDLLKPNSEIDCKSNTSEAENIAAKLLDDLYGMSWRKNKKQILTKSEPRKPNKPSSSNRLLKTERKQNHTESAWNHRLKKLCDSDTNSEGDTSSSESYKSADNLLCKKLNFSDSEDDSNFSSNITPSSTTKTNTSTNNKKVLTKKRSSTSSNDIDFNERDNDSLGTRVKKRLAKRAQTYDNLNNCKTKLENKNNKNPNIENTNKVEKIKNKNQQNDNFGYDERKCSFLKSLSGGIPPWQCDPDAHFYKTNYKTKKSILAKKLFDLYNEKIFEKCIPNDTPLEWNDRMRGTAGFCYNKRITKPDGRVLRSCRIVLATKILDTADRLRDTLVHEMCHAATWLVNNVSDGHGQYWKSWVHKALKTFPELPPIKRCHDYQINTKYTYKCVDCGYSIGRHSKSLDIERKRCGYCYGKFEIFINKVNKHGEKQITPATPRGKASGFALFVKENYNSVKSEKMKHAEVMRILGQKFSELKVLKN